MHEPLDPGLDRRLNQGLRVYHGLTVIDAAVVKAHPVSVENRRGPFKLICHSRWVIEVEGDGLYLIAERIGTIGMIRKGFDPYPTFDKKPGYVFAQESKCTGYHLKLFFRHF
jgi:hypothetical protein